MKKIFVFIALFIPSVLFAQVGEQLGSAHPGKSDSLKSFAVVELFSSEDCSSCPTADAMVNKIAIDAATAHQPVFVLEEHVDYLKTFGWKDTFALEELEDRQLDYQQFFKRGGSYTPQILINGTHEVYAANLSMANLVLEQALKEPARVIISFSVNNYNDSSAEVDYHLSSIDTNWEIHVAFVQKIGVSHVTAGENSGRTLTHVNIVKQLESDDVTIPDGIIEFNDIPNYSAHTYSVIAFIQDKKTMKIIGATQMDI